MALTKAQLLKHDLPVQAMEPYREMRSTQVEIDQVCQGHN